MDNLSDYSGCKDPPPPPPPQQTSELNIVTGIVDEIVDECRNETNGVSPGFDNCITNALVSKGITNFTLADTDAAISQKLANKSTTTLKENIISRVMARRQEHKQMA
jgi:hypothetical protein